jgi:hypothetical protein
MSPVERAFQLAQSGNYENFTQVKKALRREFNVERELIGRSLSSEITRICRGVRASRVQESLTAPSQACS